MPKNFKYLKAVKKDGTAVVDLHALLYKDDTTKKADKIIKEVHIALAKNLIWVAKIDNKIIGYIICKFFDKKHKYFPNSIFIDGLYVTKEYRGNKIGRKLMELVLANKFPKQYTYFSITHDSASKHLTKFYKSLGFVENGVTAAGNIKLIKKIKNKKEIYVDPRHLEHAFGLPFWRDNEKLWALKVPVEKMDTSELMWILDVPFWEDANGNIVITPREVVENPDNFPEHQDKLKLADTSYPIDIMKNKKGKWLTLDGLHRLVKLIMEGKSKIKVRKIPPELIHLTARDE